MSAMLEAPSSAPFSNGPIKSLVDRVRTTVRRYVVLTEAQALAIALWVIHTHEFQHHETTPYLLITSPEPRCGKTRLLEVLEPLAARSESCTQPSEAVVYRLVDQYKPTLMLDEVDTIFSPKTADHHEGLRAMINAGNRQSGTVARCENFGRDLVKFSVWCPKLLAGIGNVPDTIADRSIPIRLQRKTRDEAVERFRRRDAHAELSPLHDEIAIWAAEHGEALGAARPELPDELNDRAQDAREPLLAIADALGHGDEARAALIELMGEDRYDSTETARIELLADLREIFLELGEANMSTDSLIMHLTEWRTYMGRGLNANDVSYLLKPYGVRPKPVRVTPGEDGKDIKRGYSRDDLHNAWERYLPVRIVEGDFGDGA